MSDRSNERMVGQSILSVRRVGDIVVAAVELSELTSAVADTLLVKLRDSLAAGEAVKLVLDLSNVKFMDSIALGSLVALLRRVKQVKGRLALTGLTGHCLRVMQVTGLANVFEVYDDVAAAAEVLQRPV